MIRLATHLRSGLKILLLLSGKGDRKVIAIFGASSERCSEAVRYVRQGAPAVPIWLYSAEEPAPETAVLCEHVTVDRNTVRLLVTAERELWRVWVAFTVATWTGEEGKGPLKLAPFVIPPFRALVMNEHGGFFPGSPGTVLLHVWHRMRAVALSGWQRAQDLTRGSLLFLFALFVAGIERMRRSISFLLSLARLALWLANLLVSLAVGTVRSGWHRAQDLARGSWFYLLARFVKSYPAYAETVFARVHGTRTLDITGWCSSGGDVICFEYEPPHVDWQGLSRLARSSTSRLILLLERGASDDVEDLLPLFEDERTFAASRQIAFQDGMRCLFARAPVLPLQPGEASRVLAPVSGTMIVDRAKLLALGIVETSHALTGWLILFWKAAAAGFRSYSVGASGPLKCLPLSPVQDAEFVVRLLSDPPSMDLGPQEADLLRGSIAFHIGAARQAKKRPVVLVVSPYLPYPLAHGGAVRIYNLCRALSGSVDFLLAAFRERNDVIDYGELHEIFREVRIVDKETCAVGDSKLPDRVREYRSRSMSALIAELCREKDVDVLQIEYTHLAPLRGAAPHVPAILVAHDLTFALYRQLAELSPTRRAWRDYQRWLAFERDGLRNFEAVWAVSPEDRAAAIREGAHPDRTFVVPNGVDTSRFIPGDNAATELEILFVGSFRHLPNILGFEKLLWHVMPRVWRRSSDARLSVVAGLQPKKYWREFTGAELTGRFDSRVTLHGFVGDLRPLYKRARVAVVPLVVSAGTNIKLLEAMACGKPVVTTPIGCHGLGLVDGHDALIRADWDQFAEALIDLLADAELRERIGSHARRTAKQRFRWTDIAGAAYDSYRKITGQSEVHPACIEEAVG